MNEFFHINEDTYGQAHVVADYAAKTLCGRAIGPDWPYRGGLFFVGMERPPRRLCGDCAMMAGSARVPAIDPPPNHAIRESSAPLLLLAAPVAVFLVFLLAILLRVPAKELLAGLIRSVTR